jgi:triosephosphate isomerase (TIM)
MTAKPRGITIAGNWKMNHGLDATSQFFEGLKSGWNDLSEDIKSRLSTNEIKVICFPPFLSLGKALEASSNISLSIGAQNAHWEESGAFTGEVSGPMLKEFGINHVLVGHSERRQFFGETNESARERTIGLLKQGFQVMLCVGETKEEREANRTEEVVLGQLKAAIKESDFLNGQLTIAYGRLELD